MKKTIRLISAILFMAIGVMIMLPIIINGGIPPFLTILYALLNIGTGVLMLVLKKDVRFYMLPVALYFTIILVMSFVNDSFTVWTAMNFIGVVLLVLACFIKPVRKIFAIIGMVLAGASALWSVFGWIRGMGFAMDYGFGMVYICYLIRDLCRGGAFVLFGIGLMTMGFAAKQPAQPNYAYAGYGYAAAQNNYAAPVQPVQPVRPVQPVQPVQPAAPAQSGGLSTDATEMLMRYKKLLDAGILTQEEFEAKKRQILGL